MLIPFSLQKINEQAFAMVVIAGLRALSLPPLRRAETRLSSGEHRSSCDNYVILKRATWSVPHCAHAPRAWIKSLQARSFLFSEAAWLILECARRTRSFWGRAFREQEDNQAASHFPVCALHEQGTNMGGVPW